MDSAVLADHGMVIAKDAIQRHHVVLGHRISPLAFYSDQGLLVILARAGR